MVNIQKLSDLLLTEAKLGSEVSQSPAQMPANFHARRSAEHGFHWGLVGWHRVISLSDPGFGTRRAAVMPSGWGVGAEAAKIPRCRKRRWIGSIAKVGGVESTLPVR